MQYRESFRQQHLFTDVALESCGFQVASRKNIGRELYRVVPTGKRSALFSTIIQSLNNLKNLYLMIEDSGTAYNWKLYLVVIISDHDNASPQDWNDVKRAYREAKQRIRVNSLNVIFVAYNVTQSVYEQLFFLQNLDDFGSIPLHLASNQQASDAYVNISRLMQKLRDSEEIIEKVHRKVGERQESKRNENRGQEGDQSGVRDQLQPMGNQKVKIHKVVSSGRTQNVGVLFAISQAERYQGETWVNLCHGVQTFCKYLGGEDLFGCILFSQQCKYFFKYRFLARGLQLNMLPDPPVLGPDIRLGQEVRMPAPMPYQPNNQLIVNAPLLAPLPNAQDQEGHAVLVKRCLAVCCLLIVMVVVPIIIILKSNQRHSSR